MSASTEKPRIVDDPYIYGGEFRCVDGAIEHRYTPPGATRKGEWRPITRVVRGNIVCELSWIPDRLRVWADLLDRPNEDEKSPETDADFPAELATSPGDSALNGGRL